MVDDKQAPPTGAEQRLQELGIELPVIVVTGLLRFMDATKVFDTIYVLTSGGPGYSTEMLSSGIPGRSTA